MKMKKLFIAMFVCLSAMWIQAQIPNGGFESWTSMGTYDTPDNWGNMNPATASAAVFTTAKGTPGSSGTYFVKLTTKDVSGTVTPGMIVSGQLNTTTWKPKSGFPFTQQAQKLTGKYQYMGYNGDSATISAWLTRWNQTSHRRDTVATLKTKTSGMVHTWTAFAIPFAYKNALVPDTAVIMISSSATNPQKNSFIWVDELQLQGVVTDLNPMDKQCNLSVYPSPAKDMVNIIVESKRAMPSQLRLLNITGKVVYETVVSLQPGENKLKLELGKLKVAEGVYFVRLSSADGLLTKKIVVQGDL